MVEFFASSNIAYSIVKFLRSLDSFLPSLLLSAKSAFALLLGVRFNFSAGGVATSAIVSFFDSDV